MRLRNGPVTISPFIRNNFPVSISIHYKSASLEQSLPMSVKTIPYLIAALLLVGAVALLLTIAQGYDYWLAIANAASAKGSAANYLTPDVWIGIRRKALACAALLTALACISLWKRSAIASFASAVWCDAYDITTEFTCWLRSVIAEDGRLL